MKIAYFVHDTGDAAVRRRVRMLQIGGGEPSLVGFRRAATPPSNVEGAPVTDLGRTHDGRFAQRLLAVGGRLAGLSAFADLCADAEVFLARNLEMLLLAARARDRFAPGAALVYECLDVHRLMLDPSAAGRLLRALERRLAGACDLLLVSSPAFLDAYFRPRGQAPIPALVVENRQLDDPTLPDPTIAAPVRRAGPPWRVGWFGALRDPKGLEVLKRAAAALDGRLQVVVRGRPSPAQFPDFEAAVRDAPHVAWRGAYRNPEDLAEVYGDVHFTWAVDFYEAGQNSAWLLPNRLYEGGLHGAVPLAQAGVETGRWLAARSAGVLLDAPLERSLVRFFETLTPEIYAEHLAAVERLPADTWRCSPEACRELVAALGRRAAAAPASRAVA